VAAAGAPGPDDPQPLSEAEAAEKEALLGAGFSGWNRRDFASFTKACEKARGGPQARALHSLAGAWRLWRLLRPWRGCALRRK